MNVTGLKAVWTYVIDVKRVIWKKSRLLLIKDYKVKNAKMNHAQEDLNALRK